MDNTQNEGCRDQCEFEHQEDYRNEGGSVNYYWWYECKHCGEIGERSLHYDLFY